MSLVVELRLELIVSTKCEGVDRFDVVEDVAAGEVVDVTILVVVNAEVVVGNVDVVVVVLVVEVTVDDVSVVVCVVVAKIVVDVVFVFEVSSSCLGISEEDVKLTVGDSNTVGGKLEADEVFGGSAETIC